MVLITSMFTRVGGFYSGLLGIAVIISFVVILDPYGVPFDRSRCRGGCSFCAA